MPIYIYSHPTTNKVKEIYQSMNDEHTYAEDGVVWKRVFCNPQAKVDGKYNCWSSEDFKTKTRNKKGTIGDLWNLSKELSAEREAKGGVDQVKQKAISDYESAYKRPHPETRKQKLKESADKLGLKIED